MKHPHKILLGTFHKGSLYAATLLLWLSGALWLYWQYMTPSHPPGQSLCMKIHGAAAMVFLMVFGGLLLHHVPVGWKQDRQRPSGIGMVVLVSALIVTGWLLYYAGSDRLRQGTSLAHWVTGLLFPLFLGLHVHLGRRS